MVRRRSYSPKLEPLPSPLTPGYPLGALPRRRGEGRTIWNQQSILRRLWRSAVPAILGCLALLWAGQPGGWGRAQRAPGERGWGQPRADHQPPETGAGGSLRLTTSHPAPAGIKTDRGVYPLLPVKLPAAGETFLDPTFGTRMLRVTGPPDGPRNQHAYSYWPSFNQDNTQFFIDRNGRPTLYRFDPGRLKILGQRPLFSARSPDGSTPGWEDAIFSGQDPNLLFCHAGLKLWCYHVATGAYHLVKDFAAELPPGHLRQMSKSLDDNTFGFSRQEPQFKVVGCLVWKRDTDKIVLRQDTPDLDEIQVDKSGQYCVIKTARQGKGVVEARVAELRSGRIEDLTDDGPDYAPGHSDNGQGTVIGADNWQNRVTFRRLATPHQLRAVLELKNDWSQDYHISLLADDENWVLMSFYVGNKLLSAGVFRGEIVQVATDGSGRVRRLAHHRSVVREYWDSPRANISRDGRCVLFTSNWEGSGQRDVFILEVPPAASTLAGRRRN